MLRTRALWMRLSALFVCADCTLSTSATEGDSRTRRRVKASTVGAFALPLGSKDAALLATVAPGVYTFAITNGASVSPSSSGVVMGEIYLVP